MDSFTGLGIDHQAAAMEAIGAMAGTVACHARAGTRPGPWRGNPARWVQELPRPYADTGGNGKPRVLLDETFVEVFNERAKRVRHVPVSELPGRRVPPGAPTHVEAIAAPPLRKGVYRVGSYCPLEWRPDPSKLVIVRAEWAAWRMGLELLWLDLEGRLESIAVLPPAAPWQPWVGEREAHGRPPELFRGLRDEPYRCETREQTAMRRRAAQRRALEARAEEARPTHQRRAANATVVDPIRPDIASISLLKRNSGGFQMRIALVLLALTAPALALEPQPDNLVFKPRAQAPPPPPAPGYPIATAGPGGWFGPVRSPQPPMPSSGSGKAEK